MDRHATQSESARDAATVLPFLATLLLMPPLVLIFTAPLYVAGIPLIVLYVFGVWAMAILGACLAARHLAGLEDEVDDIEPGTAGDGP